MKRALSWLGEQWKQSNIITGILALGIWGSVIVLAFQGREIPAILATGAGAIIVFYYRAKAQS